MLSRTLILTLLAPLGPVSVGDDRFNLTPPAVGKPLPEMLAISWKKGPSLPQGFQDSDGGIVADTLVTVAGFCSGQKNVPGKPDRYPRGFLRKVWGLSLTDRAARWQALPDFPGVARQGLDAVVVGKKLFCWGGFSYTEPCCYRDGYCLFQHHGKWQWRPLPALPWALTAHGSCALGSKIFVVGGADYDGKKGFYTNADRAGRVKRLGARLLMFDTANPGAGWKEGPPCPGTPRFVHSVAAVAGKVYVFGGATGSDNPENGTFTVVDNWRYDPDKGAWKRLPDLPVASGNFPSGPVAFAGRYILLIGGYQYGKVMNPDGRTRPTFGTPQRHYPRNSMCSDIFVYDTRTDTFGRATAMPLNNNLPMAVVHHDRLHLIGGEIDAALIEGEHYGHHPDLYLVGTIREAGK